MYRRELAREATCAPPTAVLRLVPTRAPSCAAVRADPHLSLPHRSQGCGRLRTQPDAPCPGRFSVRLIESGEPTAHRASFASLSRTSLLALLGRGANSRLAYLHHRQVRQHRICEDLLLMHARFLSSFSPTAHPRAVRETDSLLSSQPRNQQRPTSIVGAGGSPVPACSCPFSVNPPNFGEPLGHEPTGCGKQPFTSVGALRLR